MTIRVELSYTNTFKTKRHKRVTVTYVLYDRTIDDATNGAGNAVEDVRLAYSPPRPLTVTLIVSARTRCGTSIDRFIVTLQPVPHHGCITPELAVTFPNGKPIRNGATIAARGAIVVIVDAAENAKVAVIVTVKITTGRPAATYTTQINNVRTRQQDGHSIQVVHLGYEPSRPQQAILSVIVRTTCGRSSETFRVTLAPPPHSVVHHGRTRT